MSASMRTVKRSYSTIRIGSCSSFISPSGRLGREAVFERIRRIIERYGLSQVSERGYAYYGCDSSAGLSRVNKEPYLRLRRDFNAVRTEDDEYFIMLYVLIVYSFNNQIRFNRKGEFNLPVGKRDFNRKLQKKLAAFIDRLQTRDCLFSWEDFRSFDISALTPADFVYIDPPYLITCATYNERDGWNEERERELLAFMDRLHERRHSLRPVQRPAQQGKGEPPAAGMAGGECSPIPCDPPGVFLRQFQLSHKG